MTQTVICIKWGTLYGIEYLNRLASMVQRNTKRPTRLVCFTDDGVGADLSIEIAPLPPINLPQLRKVSPWRKVSLWQNPLHDLSGDVLFLDLDIVITGSIDEIFDYEPGKFCIAQNWTQPGGKIGNTSVYRFPVGEMTYIFDEFARNGQTIVDTFPNSQTFISTTAKEMTFFPPEWCVSFKHTLMPTWPLNFFVVPPLPPRTKVVAFTGKPDPHEARDGIWPVNATWKKLYKHVRPTPWIAEHWR